MSSYRDWHVGMKVVFVGGTTHFQRRPRFFGLWKQVIEICALTHGDVFTIREIGMGRSKIDGEVVVGIKISPDPKGDQPGYYAAKCFRPVHTRASDISAFTAMLNGASKKVSV